ncbi:MAG: NADAR family protein [Pseudonocardia sp.]
MTPDELAAAEDAGRLPPMLHFWRPDPQPDGRPGPGCLSQWWPAPFTVDGVAFPTAEHYMMWRKALLFGDVRAADVVLADPDPAAAKAAGRAVAGFEGPTWVVHRFDVVVDGNRAKFAADAALRGYLVDTGHRVLVEASPDDAVWGIGLADGEPDAAVPSRWRGYNLLGFALMQVRDELAGR